MAIGTYISVVSLNVNELNAPTNRQRLADWIQKQDSYICCLQETHFRPKDTYRLKVRRWKNILNNGDPYYNPNLTLEEGNFGLNPHAN